MLLLNQVPSQCVKNNTAAKPQLLINWANKWWKVGFNNKQFWQAFMAGFFRVEFANPWWNRIILPNRFLQSESKNKHSCCIHRQWKCSTSHERPRGCIVMLLNAPIDSSGIVYGALNYEAQALRFLFGFVCLKIPSPWNCSWQHLQEPQF